METLRGSPVVVAAVDAEHVFEVAAAEDEEPVEAVGANRPHPAFGVGVRVRRLDRRPNHLDALGAENEHRPHRALDLIPPNGPTRRHWTRPIACSVGISSADSSMNTRPPEFANPTRLTASPVALVEAAAHSITDLLSSTEARSSSALRTEPYDIHVLGLDFTRPPRPAAGRVQKRCRRSRVQLEITSTRVDRVSPVNHGPITGLPRSSLRAGRVIRAHLTSTVQICYSRARVKLRRRVREERGEERVRRGVRRSVVSGCVFVFVDQAAE
jgi:hypothetical protein